VVYAASDGSTWSRTSSAPVSAAKPTACGRAAIASDEKSVGHKIRRYPVHLAAFSVTSRRMDVAIVPLTQGIALEVFPFPAIPAA
jgi:hypothetical protein